MFQMHHNCKNNKKVSKAIVTKFSENVYYIQLNYKL